MAREAIQMEDPRSAGTHNLLVSQHLLVAPAAPRRPYEQSTHVRYIQAMSELATSPCELQFIVLPLEREPGVRVETPRSEG